VALALLIIAGMASVILSDTMFDDCIFWIELFCCTFSVYAAAISDKSEGFSVGRLLGLLVIAGDGSYSTYLLHGFIMGPTARLIAQFDTVLPVYVFSSLMVIICTIVGVYCYKYFELPVQRTLSRLWNVKSDGVKKKGDLHPCVGER
jgi:peptidoglycan/LPS O-acetylase OafA/YrhL